MKTIGSERRIIDFATIAKEGQVAANFYIGRVVFELARVRPGLKIGVYRVSDFGTRYIILAGIEKIAKQKVKSVSTRRRSLSYIGGDLR